MSAFDAPDTTWCPQCQRERVSCSHLPDQKVATDGGVPTLTGTGAANDLQATEKQAFRVRSKLTDEDTARELRNLMVRAGIDSGKLEIVEERFEVDSR